MSSRDVPLLNYSYLSITDRILTTHLLVGALKTVINRLVEIKKSRCVTSIIYSTTLTHYYVENMQSLIIVITYRKNVALKKARREKHSDKLM